MDKRLPPRFEAKVSPCTGRVPGPWNLLLCTAVAIPKAFHAWRTAQEDADLEKLYMAVKEKPPRGLLARFSHPLRERLGLTAPRPDGS